MNQPTLTVVKDGPTIEETPEEGTYTLETVVKGKPLKTTITVEKGEWPDGEPAVTIMIHRMLNNTRGNHTSVTFEPEEVPFVLAQLQRLQGS